MTDRATDGPTDRYTHTHRGLCAHTMPVKNTCTCTHTQMAEKSERESSRSLPWLTFLQLELGHLKFCTRESSTAAMLHLGHLEHTQVLTSVHNAPCVHARLDLALPQWGSVFQDLLIPDRQILRYTFDAPHMHISTHKYWVVQVGLLTPLTFTVHHLSPLAVFSSGVYSFDSGRWQQWIREVYNANLKGIFEGPLSECVWQQARTCCLCYRMLKNTFLFTHLWSSGQTGNNADTYFSLSINRNSCKHGRSGICIALQF